jgi:PAS domain S-box-containing protein
MGEQPGSTHDLRSRKVGGVSSQIQQLMVEGFDTDEKGTILIGLDPQHPIVYCNKAFTDITGYESGEIIGRSITNFLQYTPKGKIDPSMKDKANLIHQSILSGQNINVQLPAYKKSGEKFISRLKLKKVVQADDSGNERIVGYIGHVQDATKLYWISNALLALLGTMLLLYVASILYTYYHKPPSKVETFWTHLQDYFPSLPNFSTVKKETEPDTLWSHLKSYFGPSYTNVKKHMPDVAAKHM